MTRVRRRRRGKDQTATFRVSFSRLALPLVRSAPACVFAFLVLLAPFPVGLVEWPWISLWAILLASCIPFLGYNHLKPDQRLFLIRILAGLAILLAFMGLQASTILGLLPENPLYTESRKLLQTSLAGYPTAAPAQSQLVSGGYALAVLVFVGSFIIAAKHQHARLLILAIGMMALANGFLGYLLLYSNPKQIFWIVLEHPRQHPSGTFTNRNHAATLFACSTVIFFSIALHRFLMEIPRGVQSWRQRWQLYLLKGKADFVIPLLLAFVGLALTISTLSRGGLLAMLCGLGTAYFLLFLRIIGKKKGAIALLATMVLGLIVLSQSRFGPYGERFSTQRLAEDGRFEIYKAIGQIIKDHPGLGQGPGHSRS